MRVRFWGTRGSLPVAMTAAGIRRKLVAALVAANGRDLDTAAKAEAFVDGELDFAVAHTYGGNSSCVQVDAGGPDYLLCDLGTGVRPFGNRVIARDGPQKANVFHVLMSHLHWDHIMGFPFFTPAYIPGNLIRIYGCHAKLEEAFRRQQSEPCFPVHFDQLRARIEFVTLTPGQRYDIGGVTVTPKLQLHAGDSYGYRLEREGKAVVYSTDSEHKPEDLQATEEFVEFIRGADLLIFDAMYSLADSISVKEDWGHSSNIVGVELAQRAGARHLVMFHHEPVYSDEKIDAVLKETLRFEELSREARKLVVTTAYDGLEIVV